MPDREEAGRQHDEHRGEERGGRRRETGVAHQDHIEDPAQHAGDAAEHILPARYAEQDGEGRRADEGGDDLHPHLCREGVDRHPLQDDHRAGNQAVAHEGQGHAGRDAKEHEKGVEQARGAGDVILVRHVADAVDKRHAGNQRDDGADDHIGEAAAEADAVEQDAERGDEEAAHDVAYDLGHMRRRHEQHEEPEQRAADERGGAVQHAAAEHDAETGAAEGRGQHLFPAGVGRHRPDDLQLSFRFLERIFPVDDVAGKLVDGHHLVELRPLEGNELHVCVFVEAAGGEDAVAQHEEALGIHAVMRSDALHRLFDAGNFRTVLEQDVARFRSHGQRFRVPRFLTFVRFLQQVGHFVVL